MKSTGSISTGRIELKSILLMQGVVIIYTLAGVMGKMASSFPFLSAGFILWYMGEILMLGVYAILWQQIIKRFDLTVAYANRAVALLWSMIWAVLFFKETVTVQNLIGIAIVLAGTFIVNLEANKREEAQNE